MNSISIGRKKQSGHEVNIRTQKEQSGSRSFRKITPIKQQQQQTSKKPGASQKESVFWRKRLSEGRSYVTLSANSSINNVQPYHDKRICSVRAGIITFIIVVVLIIIATICLGIVFGVVKSQNSSDTGSNNQNSLTTVSSGSLTSSISIGSQTGAPCSGYTEINDPTRNYTYIGSLSNCDNGPIFNSTSGGAWIRFSGTGGTALAQTPPGTSHCGGFLPVWYNGSLSIPTNTITNGTACVETGVDTCALAIDISLVLCSPGNYYVFFLPPLYVCSSRYCTA